MRTYLPIGVLAAALIFASTSNAAIRTYKVPSLRTVQHRAVVSAPVIPGRVTTRRVRVPRIHGDWDRLSIRIAGKLADISDWRDCEIDSARHKIIATINNCGDERHLTVTTATTGHRRARVTVALVKFAPTAVPSRTGF